MKETIMIKILFSNDSTSDNNNNSLRNNELIKIRNRCIVLYHETPI